MVLSLLNVVVEGLGMQLLLLDRFLSASGFLLLCFRSIGPSCSFLYILIPSAFDTALVFLSFSLFLLFLF